MQKLQRRGFDLGAAPSENPAQSDSLKNWHTGLPVLLPQLCKNSIGNERINIQQTEHFVLSVLEGVEADTVLAQAPYQNRFDGRFESLGAAYNQGDDQEVEMVMFDAIKGEKVIAEDLWMKISWLSFHDDDVSIRFRFSFGVDLAEDVAADSVRQQAAAELAEVIFPESSIITENSELLSLIGSVIDEQTPTFVERIVYFNGPNGGAYLHHDLERGHAGVVYAQITGATCWLALPLKTLVDEIEAFVLSNDFPQSLNKAQQIEIQRLCEDKNTLGKALNSFKNDAVIHLINETEDFVQHLIRQGHYRLLSAGDAILLPQKNPETCCWHSVFCLGEEMGQALSFAIR